MREIKFRVWDHNTDTMMIPDNFEFLDGEIGWIEAVREAGPRSGIDGYPGQMLLLISDNTCAKSAHVSFANLWG